MPTPGSQSSVTPQRRPTLIHYKSISVRLKYSWAPTRVSSTVFQIPVFFLISTRGEGLTLFEHPFQTDLVHWVIRPHVCGLCVRVHVCSHTCKQTLRKQRRKEGWRESGSKVQVVSLLKTYQKLCVTPDKLSDHHMIYLSPLEATRHKPLS